MIVVTILEVGMKVLGVVMTILEAGTKVSEAVITISEDGMKIPEVGMIILEEAVAVTTISEAVAAGGMDTEVGLIFVEVLKDAGGIEVVVVVLPEVGDILTTIVEVKGQDLLAVVDVDLIKENYMIQEVIFGNKIILHETKSLDC